MEDRALAAGKTRSELEDRFLLFCRRRGLPLPETNVELAVRGRTLNVDCVWRKARVVLELDGRRAHDTATAFEADRSRDRALVAAGWRPTRATWTHLHAEADALEADLRAALRLDRSRINHPGGG